MATSTTTATIPFIIKDQTIEFIQLFQNETQQKKYLVKEPIYMSTCGRFMVLSKTDDKIILFPHYTHLGAFGRIGFGRKRVTIEEGSIISEKRENTHWLVSKIPSDLVNIIDLPKDLYIHVGTYPLFTDDGHGGPLATKVRKVTKEGNHIHKLIIDHSMIEYAMVSSSILLKGGLQGNPCELIKIADSLRQFGLDVFSCHCQHHALVFRQTPHSLSITLRERPEIVQELVLLAPPYEKERIEKWALGYMEEFK